MGTVWGVLKREDFFDFLREKCTESMALIALCDDNKIYYYDAGGCGLLWFVEGKQSAMLAYYLDEDLNTLHKRVRLWQAALDEGISPSGEINEIGLPEYGAKRDLETGEFKVVWGLGGDWMGIMKRNLEKKWNELPAGWPESYRQQITKLLEYRNVESN